MAVLRIATYNVHKCVGVDRRYSPERIAEVIGETGADVVALQEVVCHSNLKARDHQARFIAEKLGMEYCVGENRLHNGGDYGNATLSRFQIKDFRNIDITIQRREPRGCLAASIDIGGGVTFQFLNLHMGTSFFERRKQIHKLVSSHAMQLPEPRGRRIIAGDLNEWTNGLATMVLKTHYKCVNAKEHLGTARTFPGIVPLVHLDHIYFDTGFRLVSAYVHKSRAAIFASDHLPIVAEFEVS
jgi:endonuclease/exonuclease/phosphatase family metal-dependent hydrolase